MKHLKPEIIREWTGNEKKVLDKLFDISSECENQGITKSEISRASAFFLVLVSMAIDNDSYSSTDYTMELITSAITKVRADQPEDLILRTLP